MKTTTKKENNQEEDFCEKQFWTLQNVDELFMEYNIPSENRVMAIASAIKNF